MKALTSPATIVLALCLGACASADLNTERRVRSFDPGEYTERPKPTPGSLFPTASRGLLEDPRPQFVGDVIIVRVDESDSALHDATTSLSHEANLSMGVTGSLEKLAPDAGLAQAFGAKSEESMEGGGRIQRRGSIQAMLPVRVKQVLPNGDLYVEGTKIVNVGQEQRELYVSGVVRPADILADGSVASSRISDAEIGYSGKGDVTAHEESGWLTKVLRTIWPF